MKEARSITLSQILLICYNQVIKDDDTNSFSIQDSHFKTLLQFRVEVEEFHFEGYYSSSLTLSSYELKGLLSIYFSMSNTTGSKSSAQYNRISLK